MAEDDSGHRLQGLVSCKSRCEPDDRFLSLAAHNEVYRRLLLHDLGPMKGGEDATIDNPCVRVRGPHCCRDARRDRMARRRARVAEQHGVGGLGTDFGGNGVHGHGSEFGVQEPNVMPGVEQRASQGQQAQGRQMLLGDAAAHGRMRRIDEQDVHRFSRDMGFDSVAGALICGVLAGWRHTLCITKYMTH